MQWSNLGHSQAAVVGYNAEGNFFQNHPSSGFATIAEIVSCGANQERRKRQGNGQTRMPLLLPRDPEKRRRARRCNLFFDREVSFFMITSDVLATLVADYPCPRKLNQAVADAARFVLHTASPLCYVSSVFRARTFRTVHTATATQQCCYDNTGWAALNVFR